MKKDVKLRRYHAQVWSEPIIMEMGRAGERGVIPPLVEEGIRSQVGRAEQYIPTEMRRKEPPRLPEIAQPQVVRHYEHLSQETLGMDENIDIGEGTCTMKYSPKVNEAIAASPKMSELHPFQHEDTLQGILEIAYTLELFLREISGMDRFSLHPATGSHAIYTNACVVAAYHAARGELGRRNEIITTVFSHPANAATAATAGFTVITLMPDENGYPDLAALKAACSERTAGLMITNPEDTGIFNPRISEYVAAVHEVGGLCFYDQANANGILGITRAREAGFDACHFNLHKTFSSPHGSSGPGGGAYGVTEALARFLPVPLVSFDGTRYHLEYDRPESIGKIREFMGNMQVVLRSYCWIMSMGAQGLLKTAQVAVVNNNYLAKLMLSIPGVSMPYAEGKFRLDEIRYSLEKLKKDTGIGSNDLRRRIVDFGVQQHVGSHHPQIVPEPLTPEPTESYSKEDCEYWAAVWKQMSDEAYSNPEVIRTAPHSAPIHRLSATTLDNPEKWAMTWRAYLRKRNNKAHGG
jgi:glycine dehydrogenase subunit 2